MGISGVAALITSCFVDGWFSFSSGVDGVDTTLVGKNWLGFVFQDQVSNWPLFLWYVLLITIVGLTCYTMYTVLLRYFSATLISFFGFTEAFFGAFYGWFFLGELVSWLFFVSLAIVSFGLYIFYKEELRIP